MPHDENKNNTQRPNRPVRRRRPSAAQSASYALLYVVFVISISALLAAVAWFAANDMLALNKPQHSATITIERDDSFGDVVDTLKENELVEFPMLFRLFATVTSAKDSVSSGTYTLTSEMDYRALISGMGKNSVSRSEVTVTIPEGYTLNQIFALMDEKGVATIEELEDMAANHDYAFDFLADIPLGDPHRLEGYLYPDTYTFYTPHDPKYAINKMLVNFDYRYTDEMAEDVANSGYTLHEILTISSMIERETDGGDRENIASVIYNRLDNPSYETVGRLQIDATIAYITGKEVTQNARETLDSPYNTHINKGLPPGPIASPGMNSMLAALDPANTNHFYYALGDDKVHHFYHTYAELSQFIASQAIYQ